MKRLTDQQIEPQAIGRQRIKAALKDAKYEHTKWYTSFHSTIFVALEKFGANNFYQQGLINTL